MELEAPDIMYNHVQINEHELNTIGRVLAPDTTFNCVQARLRTFRDWPTSHIMTPQSLAEAGFISTYDRDCVKCVFCRNVIDKWSQADTAMAAHRHHYPHCPYVIACDIQIKKNWMTLDTIGIALEPSTTFSCVQARLLTFRYWTASDIVTPQTLAEAGFIYKNERDRVQCVFCRGGVHNWENGDTAMEEHRRIYPHCPYVKACDNQDKDNGLLCKVCMDSNIQCLFLPCRHVACCEHCSNLISKCPVCRADIAAVLKVFI